MGYGQGSPNMKGHGIHLNQQYEDFHGFFVDSSSGNADFPCEFTSFCLGFRNGRSGVHTGEAVQSHHRYFVVTMATQFSYFQGMSGRQIIDKKDSQYY